MKQVPADYADNFKKKYENAAQMSKTSTDKAKNVFFEKIPDFKDVKMPDNKNFVKFDDSVKEDLEKVPAMAENLRHVIPPEVRSMQQELKQFIQNTLDQHYKELEKKDLD